MHPPHIDHTGSIAICQSLFNAVGSTRNQVMLRDSKNLPHITKLTSRADKD